MHTNSNDLIAAYPICCSKTKVATENGKRFEIQSNEDFTRLKIDKCIINSDNIEKCDFGFNRSSNDDFYFVELKGKNLEKAYDQIISTINFFQANLINIPIQKRFCFIVSSSGIPKCQLRIKNLKQKFFRDKQGIHLEITNNKILYKPS